MNKIKAGKAQGVCSIYPEYIQHSGSDALCTLHKIVTQVWKEEVFPEEWHQGIIIPLYKGKGSKSECSNYRGITLLSVPYTYHPCKNQTNIVVTQASSAKRIHAWPLYVCWAYQFVQNDDVRKLMKQPKLTAVIQLHRLTLFGHIMRMDDNADAKRILLASPPADWRRQLGRPRITWLSTVQQDFKQHHLTLPEAADLAQNRPLWRMM